MLVDFHGVLCSYPATNAGRPDTHSPPVPGAIAWLEKASQVFRVGIACGRFSAPGGVGQLAMRDVAEWLRRYGFAGQFDDDRAVTFTGTFPDPRDLLEFRPWNR